MKERQHDQVFRPADSARIAGQAPLDIAVEKDDGDPARMAVAEEPIVEQRMGWKVMRFVEECWSRRRLRVQEVVSDACQNFALYLADGRRAVGRRPGHDIDLVAQLSERLQELRGSQV